ncbi:glycosyltransferase family 2 protein [Kitasatospora sp. NPDC002040]|uniref:glycosyltransferase family 2 protein n=1 Tax=Kitasatospora sp. NPDC002040 TaxID=3154661 RepID=UPI00332250AD
MTEQPGSSAPSEPSAPDVTVVVAVYNTMPYLTACLTSLAEQSIGADRMEVVAVDDGSTDGSGAELERFARAHPGLFRIERQANSGGPAAPTNRATELARGRYVFYLGADDWLGPEALQRLVAMADRYRSDVVLGRMVGVGGRHVPQGIFDRTEPSVGFTDSALAWALSDTKLFRREPLVRHGLRRREDLPVYSDQPFTLQALLLAGRISVLADYDCYHAVLRADRGNTTVRSDHRDRLRGLAEILAVTDRLTEPGEVRRALHLRHFGWDVPQLLQAGLLALPLAEQRQVIAGVGLLVAEYCTVLDALGEPERLRLELAAAGRHRAVLGLIEDELGRGEPRFALPRQLWRELVPERARRELRRRQGWRSFANRIGGS